MTKIKKHHRKDPDLEDFIMYIEEETMLMSDPLFSQEALPEFDTVKERPATRNKVKGLLTMSNGKAELMIEIIINCHHTVHCPTAVMI